MFDGRQPKTQENDTNMILLCDDWFLMPVTEILGKKPHARMLKNTG